MSPKILQIAPSALFALILAFTPSLASAQFVAPYAGDINPTFGSVTDTCAFSFALFDATAGGRQVGPMIESTLRVHDGLFRTELDFGPEAFDDGSRYLEVAVGCPADTAALTTLTRRAFHPGPGTRLDRGDAEQTATQGSAGPPKAALGTAFTYQGELLELGAPVTGPGDFQFSLWDAVSGGAQIGATVPASAIAVEDGRFTASLDFGAAAFDGDARWLEIAVDYPSGTGSFTTLSPRQPLSAAPYALQTRGIYVDDTGEVGVGTTLPQAQLHVEADASRALRVRNTASSGGVAIQATAGGSTGWATAVDSYTASPDGVGVYAFNEAGSGTAYAVAAESKSPDGVAIFGHTSNGDEFSTGIGVHGRSDGDTQAAGVFGEATASSGYSYGVHGIAMAGAGVMGRHQGTGNSGSLGTSNAGVVGHVDGAADFAGYFEGGRNYFEGAVGIGTLDPDESLDVDGNILTSGDYTYSSPKTRYLNVAAIDFRLSGRVDENDTYGANDSYGFVLDGSPPYDVKLELPIRLPHGTSLRSLRFFYLDNDATGNLDLTFRLLSRHNLAPTAYNLLSDSISTIGQSSDVMTADWDLVSAITIDNEHYQYVLHVDLTQDALHTALRFYGARIEYAVTTVDF
jgi:hypothetical protein